MWKLLSERDRKSIKATEASSEEHVGPHVVTTQGIGDYQCQNCVHYAAITEHGPSEEKPCKDFGISPDAMPCAFSPKRPEMFFKLHDSNQNLKPISKIVSSIDLQQALILSSLLPAKINQLVRQEALKLPYRAGESVGFVYNQTLVNAEILDLDRDHVHVEIDGQKLLLPHETVLPRQLSK